MARIRCRHIPRESCSVKAERETFGLDPEVLVEPPLERERAEFRFDRKVHRVLLPARTENSRYAEYAYPCASTIATGGRMRRWSWEPSFQPWWNRPYGFLRSYRRYPPPASSVILIQP